MAVKGLSDIATARADATTRALGKIESQRAQTLAASSAREAEIKLQQRLESQSWDKEYIMAALQFQRQKELMALQYGYEAELNKSDWGDWMQSIGDLAIGSAYLFAAL